MESWWYEKNKHTFYTVIIFLYGQSRFWQIPKVQECVGTWVSPGAALLGWQNPGYVLMTSHKDDCQRLFGGFWGESKKSHQCNLHLFGKKNTSFQKNKKQEVDWLRRKCPSLGFLPVRLISYSETLCLCRASLFSSHNWSWHFSQQIDVRCKCLPEMRSNQSSIYLWREMTT